eukprot:UN24299
MYKRTLVRQMIEANKSDNCSNLIIVRCSTHNLLFVINIFKLLYKDAEWFCSSSNFFFRLLISKNLH